MKTTTIGGAALVATILATPVKAAGFALVTNGNDSGDGSLRHALEQQVARTVVISPKVSTIEILGTLEYAGRAPLTIRGSGQTVKTDRNVTLLAVTRGADLSISDLQFEGRRDFYSITNRGDVGQEAGKGIFIDVRDDQEGMVNLKLRDVSVAGVANHGVHVSDCSLADDCGGGSGGAGEGSPASITVSLKGVTIDDVGNGRFDADGLRVDDRGEGSIHLFAHDSSFVNVGADGVELDEGGPGDVFTHVQHSRFADNGAYCDPALLEPLLPTPHEAEFEERDRATLEADVPPEVTGSPDDACFEREVDFFDSGFVEAYEFGIDLDDGIDLDEAGDGVLFTSMKHSVISGNLDEGVDFDESGDGYLWTRLVGNEAFGNEDDGFKFSEEDGGSVIGAVRRVNSSDNGGKGLVFEEEDEGDLVLSVVRTRTSNNDDGDDTGVEAVQEEPGSGLLRVRASDIEDGIDAEGVEQR